MPRPVDMRMTIGPRKYRSPTTAVVATLVIPYGNGFLGSTLYAPNPASCLQQRTDCRDHVRDKVANSVALRRIRIRPRATDSDMKIKSFPYEDVLPFLSEHVQPSDQMLLLGCATELPLMLSRDGYGTRDTRSFIRCIDSDHELISAMRAKAEADPICAKNMETGRLLFEVLDVTGNLPELEQSSVDCVVDAGLFDKLIATEGLESAKKCADGAHRAVRLGNPLVAMSQIDRRDFSAIFDGNWGWMQELDGDPGAISQWYRSKKINVKEKVNLKDVTNNFAQLGLSFFVYTNVDNC